MLANAPADPVRSVIRSRLRLKHFEVFRHVCELHTIRKAAVASNMTQPAATKLIHELEDMFQVMLFQRTRRGMQMTPHGEILRRHIGVVMTDIGHIAEDLDRFTLGGGGTIRLGIIPSLSSTLLAQCINGLLQAHPGTRFALQEGATDGLMQQMARNELDIIFGRVLHADQPRHLRVTKVYTEAFDIVCGPHHPLAKQVDVKWKDLAKARWVLPAVGTPLREIAESMFTVRGTLRPEVAVASSSFHQMRYVIGAGSLLGVLPHSIAQTAQANGDLAILRPKQAANVAPISLMVRGDIEPSPVVAAFEATVIRTAKALGLD
ncbi:MULTISPECIES: LysR family transcriptional regulator [Hydrogenophaga]|jgi:DNA-binding transcriptional LysR family regulator|uniref:Family transcriptional regulator n=1 Tax=Hydrogenophaga intermedia TaxID=65786 RepID=A0A1L1PCZ2_HYDIT|nr:MULTISPECIES: LysR substrate-binding domain-containing protein [Hydrogenophaga]AOS79462.1 LysR family transcriptional regulator [Hydrogenophaga sp. PBC]TMU77009.1 LysR family transcriptional regulator [Hydrogenophaga intermedia]CDN86634.1 Family transcriptional regulator [Hydrogenophaga intermedia]